MFAEQLRRAVEASPRCELPKVSALLWKADAAGDVTEAEAQTLSDLIEARRTLPAPQKLLQRRLGSRPSTCLDGAAPALGRLRSLAARPGRALHPGRDGRPGRDRGRGSTPWALHADGWSCRSPGWGV